MNRTVMTIKYLGLFIWVASMAGMILALIADNLNLIVFEGFLMMAGTQLALYQGGRRD